MSRIWCDNCRQSITEGVTVVVDPIQLKTVDICINCAKYFVSDKQHPSHVGTDKIEPILLKDNNPSYCRGTDGNLFRLRLEKHD